MKNWKQALRTAAMLFTLWIFSKLLLNWSLALWVGMEVGKATCVQ